MNIRILMTLSILTGTLAPAAHGEKAKPPAGTSEDLENADSKFHAARQPDRTLVFKSTPQADLKLNVYLPPGWSRADKRPAMVFWFGGGFNHGTPGQFASQAEYLATRGLVTVCPEYRIKGPHGTGVDKCLEDARSAMRWMKAHAPELGVDTAKVIASGGSAGGTLSMLVALANGPDASDDNLGYSPRPCALVIFNPGLGSRVQQVLEKTGPLGPEEAAVAAQIMALNTPQKDEPPTIIFFGSEDREFLAVGREFCSKAEAQGTRCELWIAEKIGHGFFNRSPWREATLVKTDEFLQSLGYLKGPPTIKADPSAVLTRSAPPKTASVRPSTPTR